MPEAEGHASLDLRRKHSLERCSDKQVLMQRSFLKGVFKLTTWRLEALSQEGLLEGPLQPSRAGAKASRQGPARRNAPK